MLVEVQVSSMKRDVGRRLMERQDQIAVPLDVLRALVATHLFGTGAALLALQRPPAAHAGRAHPEALSRLPVA
jgi:hypothetical protein